jgi:hypothetical protein
MGPDFAPFSWIASRGTKLTSALHIERGIDEVDYLLDAQCLARGQISRRE